MKTIQTGGPMRVATWLEHGHGIVEVSGEVDVYTAPELRAALAAVQGRSARNHLVVQLAGLSFMDSTGLGLLVAAHKRATMAGGTVLLVEAPEFLAKVLRITGLDALLPGFPGVAEAIGHLESPDAS